MQQRIRSLQARQYYKNKYGTQTIDDDNLLDIRVGDDNTIETRQGNIITINSDDEEPKPKPIQQEIVVKKQEYVPSKLEDRINPSQTSLQQQLQQNSFPPIDNTLNPMAQLQKSLQAIKLQQPPSQQPSQNRIQTSQQRVPQQTQPTQPIQPQKQYQPPPQPPPQPKQKPLTQTNRIQTKMNIESDDEEVHHHKTIKKFVRTNDDESLPSINFRKKTDVFAQLKQRITQRVDDNTAVQISCTIRPREDSPEPQVDQNFTPVSYQDYIVMKNREINAAKQRKEDEEYRKQLLQQKKQEKVAPAQRREGETFQQYQQRMVQYLQKKNKYKNTSKVRKGTDLEYQKTAEEKQKLNELMKMVDPNYPLDEEEEKPIKPELLNYDVLLKNGLILKQAFFKPPEPEINPMIKVYKQGRYATEFIFSGGIDFDDGPYGQQSKRKPKKLPFPKHRLSLSPWEYYGVGPEEYFATRNPNFEFKQKYVPVKDYYNEMPRPKQNPKYFDYDVDQLLAKRYHPQHQEIQYQTSFVGYKQRHWTPLAHLKAVCQNVVMEYEKYERDRLFCYVVCAKVSKYQLVDTVGILTSRFTKNRVENLVMTFWKGDSKGEKKTISNLEKQVPDDQPKQNDEMLLFDEDEENEKKRKVSKEQLHLEDEWDPTKDEATERGRRNQLRKEKFKKIAEELNLKQSEKKQKGKKNNAEDESEIKQKNENEQTENEQTKKEKKRQKKYKKKSQKEAIQQQQTQIEADQFEEQFKNEQKLENQIKESDEEVFQDNEDVIFRNKLIELNSKRAQFVGNMDGDIQDGKKLFFGSQTQKLDDEKYKMFMPK